MKKWLILALACLALLFGACSSQSTDTAARYLSALERKDFEAAYSYTCQRCYRISEEEFVDAWDSLVSSLQINRISIGGVSTEKTDSSEWLTYTITYECENAGTVTNGVRARLTKDSGETRIDFDYSALLPDMESTDVVQQRTLSGPRGEIFADDGTAIAKNSYSDTIYAKLSLTEDFQKTVATVDAILSLDVDKITADYKTATARNYGTVVLKTLNRGSLSEDVKAQLLAIDGVAFDDSSMTPQRYYPYGEVLAHTVGYCGTPSEDDLKTLGEGYTAASIVGKTGLEQTYESTLHGEDGYAIELVDALGNVKHTLYQKDAKSGCDVRTSIDIVLQQKLYYALSSSLYGNQTGAALVINPKTGFVSAIGSYPSFDSNLFAYPVSEEAYNALTDKSANNPLLSRATQATYPPGSSFKPFSIVPALESGVVTADTVFPYQIVNNKWTPDEKGWVYPAVGRFSSTPGPLNLLSAMRSSDNIYFAWTTMLLGEEKFLDYVENTLCLNQEVPFDIPLKKGNIINKDTKMNRKILSDMGFGQAELLVSPVQLASMYTAFLNDGDQLTPRLVSSITQSDGLSSNVVEARERTVLHEGLIKSSTISTVLPTLREVVAKGTAHALKSNKLSLAAKTGTAIISKTRHISWIVAFYDGMEEDRLVVVMIDDPYNDDSGKFTIAKALLAQN